MLNPWLLLALLSLGTIAATIVLFFLAKAATDTTGVPPEILAFKGNEELAFRRFKSAFSPHSDDGDEVTTKAQFGDFQVFVTHHRSDGRLMLVRIYRLVANGPDQLPVRAHYWSIDHRAS